VYENAATGRSHRSKLGKAKLKEAIEKTRTILGIPEDYKIGIVPASDTGAVEMAMWSMLGDRPVDLCYWESFGKGWCGDAKLLDLELHEHSAGYGDLPDLTKTNPKHDIVFTWNGTTSGVCVPNGDWISDDREGITINDATSAAFAMDIDWSKVDVTTYSWQKVRVLRFHSLSLSPSLITHTHTHTQVLGGEGAHGMIILSPRAVERLETFTPDRPLPKIFRMTKNGALIDGIFTGATINTPSMVCVEDYLDALQWVENIGGVKAAIQRSKSNLAVLEDMVERNDWVNFLSNDDTGATRSNTSVCLALDLPADKIKELVSYLESEDVAYDIGAYRDAPPGLRIWCGATVEKSDLEALVPWLEYGYEKFNKGK
jgi:phosphoserine aminotransferase